MKPAVILVGADKGGVGKTTVSRALLDFLARKSIAARAFDTENPRGTLHRFYPTISEIIDLSNVADQMKILDTLESAKVNVTVVDMKAGSLSAALETFERIGVLKAARDGQFDLGLMHIIGPSVASLDEMAEVAPYVEGLHYMLVRNFINETNFFEWDDETHNKYFANLNRSGEIEVPKLNEMAYEQVDLAGVTFNNFIANKTANHDDADFSFVLRGYVRKWTAEIEAELKQLELIKTLMQDSGQSAPQQKVAE